MRMLLLLITALLLLATPTLGQFTDPSSVDIATLPDPGDYFALLRARPDEVKFYGPPRIRWDNRVGNLLTTFGIGIDLDSLNILTKRRNVRWELKVTSWSTPDLGLRLTYIPTAGKTEVSDTTLDMNAVPAWNALFRFTWADTAIHITLDTTGVAVGDKSYIYYTEKYLPIASIDGAMGVYQEQPLQVSLLIALWDTLWGPSDTTYTEPVSGNYPFKIFYLEAHSPNSTSSMMDIGYQVKVDSGDMWSGPIDQADSFFVIGAYNPVIQNQSRAMSISMIPADSVRLGFWGHASAVGRTVIEWVRVQMR